jgi:DNA-binding helix-hairpin-helix protein with protein kinase domain
VSAHLVDCPWCRIVQTGGPNFFLGVGLVGTFKLDRAVLAGVWKRIAAVAPQAFPVTPAPPPMPANVRPRRQPFYAFLARRVAPVVNRSGKWGVVAVVMAFTALHYLAGLGVGVCWVLGIVTFLGTAIALAACELATEEEKKRRFRTVQELGSQLSFTNAEWRQTASHYKTEFTRLKAELKKLKDRCERLQADFEAELPRTTGNFDLGREAQAREQFLRDAFISDHKIPGIGPGREVLLASYGIETAYDITEDALAVVRGIGPVLQQNLLRWKEEVLADFRYDPGVVLPDEAPRPLVLKYRQVEEGVRSQLQKGVLDLEALSGRTTEQMRSLQERCHRLATNLEQARCDWASV